MSLKWDSLQLSTEEWHWCKPIIVVKWFLERSPNICNQLWKQYIEEESQTKSFLNLMKKCHVRFISLWPFNSILNRNLHHKNFNFVSLFRYKIYRGLQSFEKEFNLAGLTNIDHRQSSCTVDDIFKCSFDSWLYIWSGYFSITVNSLYNQ